MTAALTLKQAAERLAISPKHLLRLVADGEIPASNVGRAGRQIEIRFFEADLDAFVRNRRIEPTPKERLKSFRLAAKSPNTVKAGFKARLEAHRKGTGNVGVPPKGT